MTRNKCSTLLFVHCTLLIVHCSVQISLCTLLWANCTVYIALYTFPCAHCIVHIELCILRWTFRVAKYITLQRSKHTSKVRLPLLELLVVPKNANFSISLDPRTEHSPWLCPLTKVDLYVLLHDPVWCLCSPTDWFVHVCLFLCSLVWSCTYYAAMHVLGLSKHVDGIPLSLPTIVDNAANVPTRFDNMTFSRGFMSSLYHNTLFYYLLSFSSLGCNKISQSNGLHPPPPTWGSV